MKKEKMKLVWTRVTSNGTKLFHYLKPSGDMTIRVEVPKNSVEKTYLMIEGERPFSTVSGHVSEG
jgi:hypothetical protein